MKNRTQMVVRLSLLTALDYARRLLIAGIAPGAVTGICVQLVLRALCIRGQGR